MPELEIETEDFLDQCEIQGNIDDVLQWLEFNGYIDDRKGIQKTRSQHCSSVFEDELHRVLGKIYDKRVNFGYQKLNIIKRIFRV